MQPYEQLEIEYGKWTGVENCVACNSGTAALHLAFEALDLPKGSKVILSDFNMIACARAAVMAGLVPVFVDCDDRLLIDVEKAEDALYRCPRPNGRLEISAIFATHIYGRGCDMPGIYELSDRYGLKVVEDQAEYHGGDEPNVGTRSDAIATSFYRNKIVCCADGEGGLVSFSQKECADKAKSLRSLGFTPDHDFIHIPRGHNYRMSNLHARPILESLADADHNLHKRKRVEDWYNEFIPERWHMPARDVVWVYDLRVPKLEWDRMGIVVKGLNERGIAARHGFKPMSMQPEFHQTPGHYPTAGSNAWRASNEVFYLPVHPTMTRSDVSKVADMTTKALADVGIG